MDIRWQQVGLIQQLRSLLANASAPTAMPAPETWFNRPAIVAPGGPPVGAAAQPRDLCGGGNFATTEDHERIFFGLNIGTCRDGDKCTKVKHICVKRSCRGAKRQFLFVPSPAQCVTRLRPST